jgi:hypothetical protein
VQPPHLVGGAQPCLVQRRKLRQPTARGVAAEVIAAALERAK